MGREQKKKEQAQDALSEHFKSEQDVEFWLMGVTGAVNAMMMEDREHYINLLKKFQDIGENTIHKMKMKNLGAK